MDTLDRPYSIYFTEHYWSGGANEKRFVFLEGNDLEARFAKNSDFTIGELGFGTGMNFLLTRALWQKVAPADRHMIFISYELFPLDTPLLCQIHGPGYSDVWDLYQPEPGWNTLQWGNVTLKLFIGDARVGVQEQTEMADCWFLDGFSPAHNPEMWEEGLLARIGALTKPGGTASSYSTVPEMRERLAAAGFDVVKVPGYPPKHRMMRATKL